MTNAIGTGTCNLSINVPLDERNELGRLATAAGQSLGDLMRRLLRGLESELAETESKLHREIGFVSKDGEIVLLQRAESLRQTLRRVREVRQCYYGAAFLLLFVAFIAFEHDLAVRRSGRNRRATEEEVES